MPRCGQRHRRGAAGGDLGVRLVDDPDVGDGEDRADDRLPHGVHGRVVVVVRVPLPRRGVQHRTPRARRDERLAAQVELRATHPHEPPRVELEQPGDVALDGGLPGHEHPVVGLGVVARHRLLVALAVVDVDVQPATVEEGVEVLRGVVAVEHDLGVQLGVELGQLGQRLRDVHGEVGPRRHHRRRVGVAQDDADRVRGVEDLEDLEPLDELVGPAGVAGEVGSDGNRVHDGSLVARQAVARQWHLGRAA